MASKNILKWTLLNVLLCVSLFTVTVSAQQNKTAAKNSKAVVKAKNLQAKIGQFLEQSGGSFNKVADGVWTVPFQGKSLKNFNVIIATDAESETIVVFAVIAEKKNLRLSQDLLYNLLKYNHAVDKIKVGISEEGDLNVRIDENGRLLDLQAFKDTLEQTAAASDELYEQIKGSITSVP